MRLAEIESIALNIGLAVFAAFIFFIIYDLAKKIESGKVWHYHSIFCTRLRFGSVLSEDGGCRINGRRLLLEPLPLPKKPVVLFAPNYRFNTASEICANTPLSGSTL
jgi:hypothetical protein